jgi:protein tyrosine phosphatase (PTP) superfamily phosphohydrolase (DUF442 family)
MNLYKKTKYVAILFAYWLLTGFTIGTLTLLFPVRWIIEIATKNNWSRNAQDYSILLLMILLAGGTFWLSFVLTKKATLSTRSFWKITVIGVVLFLLSMLLWLNPKLVNISLSKAERQSLKSDKSEFVFGPYPDEVQMEQLKAESFTAIISLLHPAVVPFEPVLINEEKEHAREQNLDFIHLPMLPWVSDNKMALDSVRKIAKYGKGKYYVHCYLGKDRVNLVKKAIMEVSENAIKKDNTTIRHLWDRDQFERGKIVRIDSGLYVIPYPTDEEFMGYILSSDVKNVVSLLNPKITENKPWIDKEQKLMQNQMVKYTHIPLPINIKQRQLNTLVDSIFSLARPVVVHPFKIPSEESEIIIKALKNRKK